MADDSDAQILQIIDFVMAGASDGAGPACGARRLFTRRLTRRQRLD